LQSTNYKLVWNIANSVGWCHHEIGYSTTSLPSNHYFLVSMSSTTATGTIIT
jgi:hypothetical protein